MEQSPTLTTIYEYWKLYQDHLRDALAPLTPEQLALRAGPAQRTVGEIAAHIIGARAGWFTEFLGEDWGAAKEMSESDADGAPAPSGTELIRGLETTWQLMTDALARWTSEDMLKTFPREWRGEQYALSRSWVIWHLLEHDLHHGGELSLSLGIYGLTAPDI